MSSFTSSLQKFDSKLWGHHFPIPVEIAAKFVDGNDRRVICTVNNLEKLQCALMPYPEGFFILFNANLVSKLGLRIGEKVNLVLEKDTSEFGLPMPDSFRALLDQEEEGRKYFDQLTPGKKRALIYIVGKVKNIDSQVNKGLAILDHLKTGRGNLDFKKLHQLIKDYNQLSKLK